MAQARQTAYKVWFSDLFHSNYHRETGEWDPNYVLVHDMKVSRINAIATVVDKYVSDDSGYASLELDDSSGKIQVKAWKEDVRLLSQAAIGALILLIGRVKEFNGVIYLTPEIVRNIPISWGKLRRLELTKLYGEPAIYGSANTVPRETVGQINGEIVTYSARKRIMDVLGHGEEVKYDELVSQSGLKEDEVDNVVKELIKEGEIYMPRPNYLRCI